MSGVPELKQKKIARNQALEAKAAKDAADAVTTAAELNKKIFAKAKSYEEEYNKVSFIRRWAFVLCSYF